MKKVYHTSVFVVKNGMPERQILDTSAFSRELFAIIWVWMVTLYYSELIRAGLHLETDIKVEME